MTSNKFGVIETIRSRCVVQCPCWETAKKNGRCFIYRAIPYYSPEYTTVRNCIPGLFFCQQTLPCIKANFLSLFKVTIYVCQEKKQILNNINILCKNLCIHSRIKDSIENL